MDDIIKLMDKTDIEILWVLQQSSDPLSVSEMEKKNKILKKIDSFLENLTSLKEDGFIQSQNNENYKITQKGIDLIWKGDTWEPIFRLVKLVDPERYTSNDIRRITNKSLVDCVTNIEFVRKELNLIEGQSKGFKLHFVLSEKGRSYDVDDPNTVL